MSNSSRIKLLEEDAKLLRSRLNELDAKMPTELERPIHEVSRKAVSDKLTQVGHELRRLSN